MKKAFVLGGTGFIGQHIVRRLLGSGWDVTMGSRGEAGIPRDLEGVRHVTVDRSIADGLSSAANKGFDVLVDVIPYEIADAERLLELRDEVGSIVAISSASVYSDDAGDSLDEATGIDDFPRVPVPIGETQPRVGPGEDSYSTRKAGIEDILLNQVELPVTVLRPCAIYGPDAKHCREWYFVKRVLDRRSRIVLAHEGQSVFHTTSVHNLAELVRLASERPGSRALNCGDPDPPSVREIASSIANAMEHEWDEVLIPTAQSQQPFLGNPWGVPRPWILDMSLAEQELGYVAATSFKEAIGEAVSSIVARARDRGEHAFSDAIPYLPRAFDYVSEDGFARSL